MAHHENLAAPPACFRPRQARVSRGFTLVELMVTVAVSGVVGTGMVAAALWQTRYASAQRAAIQARSQAQTIMMALDDAIKMCGFGFGQAKSVGGMVATGICATGSGYQPGWSLGPYRAACSKIDADGKSDRLRLSYLDPGLFSYLSCTEPSTFTPTTPGPPAEQDAICVVGRPAALHGAAPELGRGVPLFIGGTCQAGPSTGPDAATDEIMLRATPASRPFCDQYYYYDRLAVSGTPANALSCPNGYAAGYALGMAEVREFYTDTDPVTGLPRLMMGAQVWGQQPSVVAVGVTRFEVRYGIDTSVERDNKLHPCPSCTEDPFGTAFGGPRAWCREVRGFELGGSCGLVRADGVPMDTALLRSRIVAIHISFDLVAPAQSNAYSKAFGVGSDVPTYTFTRMFTLPNMAN